MRRFNRPLVPALLASVLILGACSSSGESESTPGASGDLPTVEGGFGEEPTITYPDSMPSEDLEVSVLSEGDGREVVAGDILVADYIGQIWDGDTFDNSFERPVPADFPIGMSMVIAGWDQGLVGQKVGSRVLLSIPSELGYAQGNEGAGIKVGDTIVFVVDIINTFGVADAGEADAKIVDGAFDDLPIEIDGELGEPVSISIKDGATPPTELVTTVLAEGSGPKIEPGTTAMHFAFATWGGDGGLSTWEDEQVASMTLGNGTTYFDELVGVPAGSRALVQIPASGGADPMAVIVDVLGQPRR